MKHAVKVHLRQIPCLQGICWACKRRRYQSLEQEEGGEIQEDKRQCFNRIFGKAMTRLSFLLIAGLTAFVFWEGDPAAEAGPRAQMGDWQGIPKQEIEKIEFKTDSPLVLYLAVMELLVCGATASTAAALYTRKGHSSRHPSLGTAQERKDCIQVTLQKTPGMQDKQLYGLGFRPSSDGMECLLVEAIRPGSIVDIYNKNPTVPSAKELIEEALGDEQDEMHSEDYNINGEGEEEEQPEEEEEEEEEHDAEGEDDLEAPPEPSSPTNGRTNSFARAASPINSVTSSAASSAESKEKKQVKVGMFIVAVNDVSGDVGLMQLQLMEPKVTLWLVVDLDHPAMNELERFDPPEEAEGRIELGRATPAAPLTPSPGLRCACIGLEDEDPQIFNRWSVFAVMFGWIMMLPILFMKPPPERPRLQIFRQYLLKPCAILIPITLTLWTLDCLSLITMVEYVEPLYYYLICHTFFASTMVWFLMQMQLADERLVLEQRKTRLEEARIPLHVVIEDPAPLFLKELLTLNPVALVYLGTLASIPIVIAQFLCPMSTRRGKMAQGYINLMYSPLALLQLASVYLINQTRWIDLPKLYLLGFGLVLNIPCFCVWCCCLCCSTRYTRSDVSLVQKQRLERASQATNQEASFFNNSVELREALHREGEVIYHA